MKCRKNRKNVKLRYTDDIYLKVAFLYCRLPSKRFGFLFDANHWYLCGKASEQEAIILATARIRYPEVNWESARYTEIHNA